MRIEFLKRLRRFASSHLDRRQRSTMMKAGILALCLCTAAPAAAQTMQWTDKAFVTANVGIQAGSHNLNTAQTFTLYDEDATVSSALKVKSGAFFDIGGGYRVWRNNVTAGAIFSWMGNSSNAAVTGSIPDPAFFDRPRAVSTSANDLSHRESALHLNATYMLPVTDKIDVGVSAGPSIFFVKQQVVGSLPISEPGPTVGTPSVTSERETTVGVNFGVDVTYLLTPKYGVGGIARYSWGSADIHGDSLTVGGLQIGGGFRMRF
jgi:hypothetical protein